MATPEGTKKDYGGDGWPVELSYGLPPLPFTRANEQYIIARASVKEIIIWFGSRILIKLNVKLPNPSILARTRRQSSKHGLYRSNEFPYPMNITASFGELFFRFHATRFCV